jgi:hypothetical protein
MTLLIVVCRTRDTDSAALGRVFLDSFRFAAPYHA